METPLELLRNRLATIRFIASQRGFSKNKKEAALMKPLFETAIYVLETCEGKPIARAKKYLRVCSVNGSYLDGLASGITACNAEFRVIMQNIYSELNNLPRINKSDMKRALSNHSRCELGEALNPNMHEDSGE